MLTKELLTALEHSTQTTPTPSNFFSQYTALQNAIPNNQHLQIEPVPLTSTTADYFNLSFLSTDGTRITARYIRPKNAVNAPLVLTFHDYNRSARGWHHLTRYIALGYAVVALQSSYPHIDITTGVGTDSASLLFQQYYADALATAKESLSLTSINHQQMMVLGDGLGGALAACVAALYPENVVRCAILNPLPCDIRRVWESNMDTGFYGGIRSYFRNNDPTHLCEDTFFHEMAYLDCVNFAPHLKCHLLLGTSLLDKTAPAATQYSFYNAACCPKRHLVFSKHDHELINFYENEQLKFLIT